MKRPKSFRTEITTVYTVTIASLTASRLSYMICPCLDVGTRVCGFTVWVLTTSPPSIRYSTILDTQALRKNARRLCGLVVG